MRKIEQTAVPGKANLEEMEEHFSKLLIGATRCAMCEAQGAEVEQLCGRTYKPMENGNKRAGNAKGSFFFCAMRIVLDRSRTGARTLPDAVQSPTLSDISHLPQYWLHDHQYVPVG